MGYHRFISALLRGEPVVVYGDGLQVRGNTYIDDCVEATVRALSAPVGEVYNVGGGEAVTVWDVLSKLEAITGRQAAIERQPARPGDQRYTFADTARLTRHLGWQPRTALDEGLARQVAWQQAQEQRRAA
jgi:nucleoside-diphosphate-sugar epimerase